MAKPEKVKVKLTHACYAGGKLRQAGDEIEIRAELVEEFTRPSESDALKALGKDDLLALAKERGIQGVTKDNNKDEIVAKIIAG